MSQQAQRYSKRVKGLVASLGLVLFTRRRRASKGDEGRLEEPEARKRELWQRSRGNRVRRGSWGKRQSGRDESSGTQRKGTLRLRTEGTKGKQGQQRGEGRESCSASARESAGQQICGKSVPGRSVERVVARVGQE